MTGPRSLALAALALTLACSDRPLETGTDSETSAGPGTSTGPSPTTGETTSSTSTTSTTSTSEPPEPTTSTGTSEPGDSATSTTTSTSGDSTTGESVVSCGPPCAEAFEIEGDVEVGPGQSLAFLTCVTRIHGALKISGGHDVEHLASLRNLVGATTIGIGSNDVLTDLSPLACLEETQVMALTDLPALTDLSPLARVRQLETLSIVGTSMASFPPFAPDYQGITELHLTDNPALTDIDVLATLKASELEPLVVQLERNPNVHSLAPLAGLLAQSDTGLVLMLESMSGLVDLVGLETIVDAEWLFLRDLPHVAELGPLANLEHVVIMQLAGMPKVTSLQGLEQLIQVDSALALGECTEGGAGMSGLTSLAGLSGLKSVAQLAVTNTDSLTSLAGVEMVHTIANSLQLIATPQLPQSEIDALLLQLVNPPVEFCAGGWDECPCIGGIL